MIATFAHSGPNLFAALRDQGCTLENLVILKLWEIWTLYHYKIRNRKTAYLERSSHCDRVWGLRNHSLSAESFRVGDFGNRSHAIWRMQFPELAGSACCFLVANFESYLLQRPTECCQLWDSPEFYADSFLQAVSLLGEDVLWFVMVRKMLPTFEYDRDLEKEFLEASDSELKPKSITGNERELPSSSESSTPNLSPLKRSLAICLTATFI